MAKSCPSSAFYWNDYYRDTRVLTLPTRAIWMDMLCRAHESKTRGKITLSVGEWARWCACDVGAVLLAEVELRRHPEVGNVERKDLKSLEDGDLAYYQDSVYLTVINRRMVREQKFKKNNAERQKRHYDTHKPNANLTEIQRQPHTVPSSSSLSSSSSELDLKKDLCPVDTGPSVANGRNYREEARTVLGFLNEKTGKKFRAVDANLIPITCRLKSGVELQDCKTLIARKVRDWGTNPDMVQYLRPQTLFNKAKFENYLAEVTT